MAVDCDCLEGELVSGTEDSDRYLASVGNKKLLQLQDRAIRSQPLVNSIASTIGLAISMRCAVLAVDHSRVFVRHGGLADVGGRRAFFEDCVDFVRVAKIS